MITIRQNNTIIKAKKKNVMFVVTWPKKKGSVGRLFFFFFFFLRPLQFNYLSYELFWKKILSDSKAMYIKRLAINWCPNGVENIPD